MGPHLTLARVEQCLQQGKAEAVRLVLRTAITPPVWRGGSPRSGKLRLYLLYECLHSRQRALVRLR
jgi:hypothetical protein